MDWLSLAFYQEIADWWSLAKQMVARPTHLDDIFHQETTHLGFCNNSIIGAGGMWINPTKLGTSIMWNRPWPSYITDALVSETNLWGTLTNSDLNIAALILNKSTLLTEFSEAITTAPSSVSDNTLTVSWITQEASTINPAVADLLRICTLH